MVTVEELHRKLYTAYHKTRLTHDIYFNLTVEETEALIRTLNNYLCLIDPIKETKSE